MPVTYKIIPGKKLVYATGTGDVTFAELMRHIEDLSRDPEYKAPMRKLVDYREVTQIDLSPEESESFALKKSLYGDRFAGEKCAIVAPRDTGFGVARAHSTLIGFKDVDIETQVFRDFDKALQWLDVRLDTE